MALRAARVVLEHLTKIFSSAGKDVVAADDVSLCIEPGELVTLLGPSGCGKTTTLRMIAGFEMPSRGKIWIGDRDVTNVPPNARDTAMVFQSYALFPHLTVRENVAYGLRFRRIDRAEAARKVDRIMSLVGLKGLEGRSPGQLSGGQQQRVALARALVVEPQVLLFDEPLSNLDAKLREQMREEIRRIQKGLSITAVYVTHDQTEAMSISDRVVVMHEGRIEQVGSPEDIYARPVNRFVADFVGKVNFIPAEVLETGEATSVLSMLGRPVSVPRLPFSAGRKLDVVVRPEELQLEAACDGLLQGTVTSCTYLGAVLECEVKVTDDVRLLATVHNPRQRGTLRPGATVGVTFDVEGLHVLPA